MSMLFLVLPAAVLIASLAVVAFVWAVRRGQFDDLDTPPLRVLGDDEIVPQRTAHRSPGKPSIRR